MKNKLLANVLFITIATLLLTLGYNNNFWRILDQKEFDESNEYCQSQVIGRVIKANKDGFFSRGGFTGWVKDDSIMRDMNWEQMTKFQKEIYTKNIKIKTSNFIIYDSQISGQGIAYALLDKILPFDNKTKLNIFWLLTSISFSLIMALFVFWVYKNFEITAAVITFISLLVSHWLTIFGKDLYFVLSTFYLPFIVILLVLHRKSQENSTLSAIKLYLISFLPILIKLFVSGFEFISSFLVLTTVPLFYYAVINKWKIITLIQRIISLVLSTLSSLFIYIIAYSFQYSTLGGKFSDGIINMYSCLQRRTYGNSADFNPAFKASLEANPLDVVKIYLDQYFIDLSFIKITFGTLIIILSFNIVVFFSFRNIIPKLINNKEKYLALVVVTFVSIFGPLSWYIIFKSHAFIHRGCDQIVWYMPFCLFAFALIGCFTQILAKDIIIDNAIKFKRNGYRLSIDLKLFIKRFKQNKAKWITIISICLVLFASIYPLTIILREKSVEQILIEVGNGKLDPRTVTLSKKQFNLIMEIINKNPSDYNDAQKYLLLKNNKNEKKPAEQILFEVGMGIQDPKLLILSKEQYDTIKKLIESDSTNYNNGQKSLLKKGVGL